MGTRFRASVGVVHGKVGERHESAIAPAAITRIGQLPLVWRTPSRRLATLLGATFGCLGTLVLVVAILTFALRLWQSPDLTAVFALLCLSGTAVVLLPAVRRATRAVFTPFVRCVVLTDKLLAWGDWPDSSRPEPEMLHARGIPSSSISGVVRLGDLRAVELYATGVLGLDAVDEPILSLGPGLMDKMACWELAEALRCLRPKLSVVICGRECWDAARQFDDPVAAKARWHQIGDALEPNTDQLLHQHGVWWVHRRERSLWALLGVVAAVFALGGALALATKETAWLWMTPLAFIGIVLSPVVGVLDYIWRKLPRAARRRVHIDTRRERITVFQRAGRVSRLRLPLSSVHALQLVDQWHVQGEERMVSYELNLVLGDGRRIHLLHTTDAAKAENAGKELAEDLMVDLWQAPSWSGAG